MSSSIEIRPNPSAEALAELTKQVGELDWRMERALDRRLWDLSLSSSESPPTVPPALVNQIGAMLWDFADLSEDEVQKMIERASDEETPLRISILGAKNQDLPWELIRHPDPGAGFLARHPWCAVVRRIQSGLEKRPPAALPLRLLLFVSAPEDLDPENSGLDYEREEELLFTALDRPLALGEVEIDVAEDGRLSTLLERLRENPCHALILSMHGTQAVNEQGRKEWGLLFEDEDTGRSAALAGSRLAARLRKLPKGRRPRLIVLSACRSARAAEASSPIAGVAQRLHEGGFERVLGMRLWVADRAAAAFSAELFQNLAAGVAVGRAVNLARRRLAEGKWLTGETNPAPAGFEEPLAQWSLPTLLDRTSGGPLIDPGLPHQAAPRSPVASLLLGDGSVQLPDRASFIGRRTVIRRRLRAFLSGKTPRIQFSGPGGVGKTALAGLFARRLLEAQPNVQALGFRAPFDLDTVYEAIQIGLLQSFGESIPQHLQTEPDRRKRLSLMTKLWATREGRPCLFILDNLEAIQEKPGSLGTAEQRRESLWFLQTVGSLPHSVRILMTGRYAMPEMPAEAGVIEVPVTDAPFGDVLRRMNRLRWPASFDAAQKRWLHRKLGGNHRALEWMAQLLLDKPQKAELLVRALDRLEAPVDTPEAMAEAVLEGMRQNLLLDELRKQLTPGQDRLLRGASLYRIPVHGDGLKKIDRQLDKHDENRRRLIEFSLLERSFEPVLEMEQFEVPPVIRELLREPGFGAGEERELHAAMGQCRRFRAQWLSQLMTDSLEAIFHFEKAGLYAEHDEIAEIVCDLYYGRSDFARSIELTGAIVRRTFPPAPWWVLTRHGLCQRILGSLDTAWQFLEKSLTQAETSHQRATALNNLGQIHLARGEYESARRLLEQSLAILREIEDRAGEAATQNNLSRIYFARGEYEPARNLLEQSLGIQKEIGDRAGEAVTLSNLGSIELARGESEPARRLLQQSLAVQREIGDRAGEAVTLNNLSQIHRGQGEFEPAHRLLQQSLAVQREIGDRAGEAVTLSNLGGIEHARGAHEPARRLFEQSLALHREVGDRAGEAVALNNLSQVHDSLRQYEPARRLLEQSLAILREIGNRAEEAVTLNNLSQIHRVMGEYDPARRLLERSLAIQREIGDRAGTIPTLHNLAHIALQAGDGQSALGFWNEALQSAMETGEAMGIFNVARDFGSVLAELGNKKQGTELLQLAMRVGNQSGIPGVDEIEQMLAELGETGEE